MHTHIYTHATCCKRLCCLCIYGSRADCFVLDNQQGGSFLREVSILSQQSLVAVVLCVWYRCRENPPKLSPFCINVFIDNAIVLLLFIQYF